MKTIEVIEKLDECGFLVKCHRNIFHLQMEGTKILRVSMCECGVIHDREIATSPRENNDKWGRMYEDDPDYYPKQMITLSKTDLKMIRDHLNTDRNYFHFSPTNPHCKILRKIQHGIIDEFGKMVEA